MTGYRDPAYPTVRHRARWAAADAVENALTFARAALRNHTRAGDVPELQAMERIVQALEQQGRWADARVVASKVEQRQSRAG